MNSATLVCWILGVVAAALICAVVLAVRQKNVVPGFLEAARAQALKSRVNLELTQGKNPKLTLRVRAVDRGQFEVRREGAADRLAEGLSLARAIRTSDPAFGERFHIDSDDEAFASAFFSDMGKRSAVQALFGTGCTSVSWDEGHATAVWEGFAPKSEDADFVGAAAAALSSMTLNVPAAGPAPLIAGGWSEKKFNAYAGIAIVAGFFSAYATMMTERFFPGRPIDGWGLFMSSLRISAPLAALGVAVCLPRVIGKSWFLKAAGKLVLAAALLFPALGYAGCRFFNSFFDDAAPVSYVLPVTGTYRSTGKHTSYYIYVRAWRPGLYNPRFEVSGSTYSRAQKGRTQAHLTTRPGRLGLEWIVSLDFTDS